MSAFTPDGQYNERLALENDQRVIDQEAVPAMLASLKELKQLLSGETYSVRRTDGTPINGIWEAIRIGDIFERADAAIAAAEGKPTP